MSENKPEYQGLKPSIQLEMKGVLSAFVAFSVAILILVIEGSIKSESIWAFLALVLIAISVPVGVVGYVISLKILNSVNVPGIGHKKSEFCGNLSMSLTVVGFVILLADSNPLLGLVLAISIVTSFVFLIKVIHAWNKNLLQRSGMDTAEDSQE